MTPFLLDFHDSQVRFLRNWQPAPDRAPSAEDLADMAQVALATPDTLRTLCDRVLLRAVRGDYPDVADLRLARRRLEAVLAEASAAITHLLDLMAQAGDAGRTVSTADELRGAAAAIQQLHQRVAERWPVCDEEELRAVNEQISRGEFLDVEEAFAEMAGSDKEALRARLDEHKRQRRALCLE
jgi:hypothetical protein